MTDGDRTSSIKKTLLGSLLVALVTLAPDPANGQQSLGSPSSPQFTITSSELTATVLEEITSIEAKLIAAAENFPEKLYNTYRLGGNQDSSTAAEVFLEVADFNATSAYQMSTPQQQHARKKPDDRDYGYGSKAATVVKLKQSFADVRKAIQDNPDPNNLQDWLFVISFSNEYYGTLRTYYRVNGLRPPQ